MKRIKTSICAALAVLLTGATFAVAANHSDTLAASAEGVAIATACSVKTYVPDQYDTVNFYGGVGDINPEDGDGITTFAHAGLVTPLQGSNVQMDTQFTLLSKKSVEEGGNGVDGWVTYSFSAAPADISSDKTYPYYTVDGTASGYFLHITNYSGTTAPNCVEVQFVKSVSGATEGVSTFFLDNAVNTPITLSLVKGDDGLYDLTFTRRSDSAELKSVADLSLDESLFVNEHGQTFWSTAIYEEDGRCDGNHWEHRGVSISSVQAYTQNITAGDVTLSQDSYEMTENGVYAPTTTVKVGDVELQAEVDYSVAYVDNDKAGTAKAVLTFYGVYGGNVVEKTFTITEPVIPEVSTPEESTPEASTPEASTPEGSADKEDKKDSGCGSVVGLGVGALTLLALGGGVALNRRKRK